MHEDTKAWWHRPSGHLQSLRFASVCIRTAICARRRRYVSRVIALCFIQLASQNDWGKNSWNCSTTCSIFKSLWAKFCAVTDFHHIYSKSILFHSDSEHHLVKMSFILPSLHHPSTLLQFLGTPLPIHGYRAPMFKYFTEAWRPDWESRVGGLCELFLCFHMRRTLLRPPENL